jgi:hypothetical protein
MAATPKKIVTNRPSQEKTVMKLNKLLQNAGEAKKLLRMR